MQWVQKVSHGNFWSKLDLKTVYVKPMDELLFNLSSMDKIGTKLPLAPSPHAEHDQPIKYCQSAPADVLLLHLILCLYNSLRCFAI